MSQTTLKRVIEVKGKMEGLLQPSSSSSKKIGKVEMQSAIVLLKTLKNMTMTLEMLSSSRIGMVVNDFRKTFPDKEVQTLGKSLLKKWKKLIPTQGESESEYSNPPLEEKKRKTRKAHVPPRGSGTTGVKRLKIKEIRNPDNLNEATEASCIPFSTDQQRSEGESQSQSSPLTPRNVELDGLRLKSRELLLAAVKGDENYPEGSLDPQLLAVELEYCIFEELKDTGFKYKSRVRSRFSNLKDSRNPDLRVMFLEGRISPAKLSKMTAEEMASDELKSLRAQFVKEAIDNAQLATVPGTKTELLKCGKCHKRNCVYNQLQTRSADEPMTTFALCNDCGHRWKFN